MVPPTCEYIKDPVVTQFQMAPCCLLVIIHCFKVLVQSVLAGAVGAHEDGASSQVVLTNMESRRSSLVPLSSLPVV